jgi:hypothetical protein
MNYLHILSEDDNDDSFYKYCIENITENSFVVIPKRYRKGGGIGEVKKWITIFLKDIGYTGSVDNTYFLISIDNDRRPVHPDHQTITYIHKLPKSEQNQKCRFCEIENKIKTIFGENVNSWPIKGVIAIPVQMLESWLLLICNPENYQNEEKLPIFAKKNQSISKKYFGKRKLPNQLKDLCEIEKTRLGIPSNSEFCIHCGKNLNSKLLQKISGSFDLFKKQVDKWS